MELNKDGIWGEEKKAGKREKCASRVFILPQALPATCSQIFPKAPPSKRKKNLKAELQGRGFGISLVFLIIPLWKLPQGGWGKLNQPRDSPELCSGKAAPTLHPKQF